MLLYRHLCLLAIVAGVMASQHLGQGCFFLALLTFFEPKRTLKNSALLFLSISFLSGIIYAEIRKPIPYPEPLWLSENLTAQEADPYGRARAIPIYIQGTVGKVTPLSNKRYRFELKNSISQNTKEEINLTPEYLQKENIFLPQSDVYKGIILVTLYLEDAPPIAGQVFKGLLRLSRVRSFSNIGSWDAKAYWRNKGVWIRGFSGVSSSKKSFEAGEMQKEHTFLGEGNLLSKLHAQYKKDFLFTLSLTGKNNGYEEIAGTSYAMLPALLFGDRSFLTTQQTDQIARSTLAHSLALSGLHLGYAVAVAAFLAFLIGKIFPPLYLRLPRPYMTLITAFPLIVLYVWIGGAPVSLLRATCMFTFWALLLLWKKPKVMLDGLIMAVAFLVILEPTAIFDISLQLSALSVATIAFFLPLIQDFSAFIFPNKTSKKKDKPSFFQRSSRAIIELLCLSMTIQLVTAPLVLAAFGIVGLWFPLNLLWLPILGTIVMPFLFVGFLFSSIGIFSFATTCFYIANIPCLGLMQLLSYMDNLHILSAPALLRPHWISICGWWILCLVFYLCHKQKQECNEKKSKRQKYKEKNILFEKRKNSIFIAIGLLLFFAPMGWGWYKYASQPVGFHIFDVGQGQAILLEWEHGRAMIDGGGIANTDFDIGKGLIAPLLTNNRPARVNYLIHSHPDTDHMSGLMYLLESFSIDTYVGDGDIPSKAIKKRFAKALAMKNMKQTKWKAGDTIYLTPLLHIEVLWPSEEAIKISLHNSQKINHMSLILRILWKNRPIALLCGDADAKALKYLTKHHAEKLQAEVLILPHHGSISAFVPQFYEAVKPSIAIASCGWQNRWHFPASKITEWFRAKGIPLYSTGASGEINMHWNNNDSVSTIFANSFF